MEDTTEKIERESKNLYKSQANKFISQKTQLVKETDLLTKWHDIEERQIERQEACMRKHLDKLEKDRQKYKAVSENQLLDDSEDSKTKSPRHQLKPSHINQDMRAKSYHPRPPSSKKASIDMGEARSVSTLKKACSKADRDELEKQLSQTKQFRKLEHERRETDRVNIKCDAFIKTEKLKSEQHKKHVDAGYSGVSVPVVIVTDETNTSNHVDTWESYQNISPRAGSEKCLSIRRKGLGKAPSAPSADQLEEFYTMAMSSAIANNPDEFMASSTCSSIRGRKSQTSTTHSPNKQHIDLAKLKEIEELLHEASHFRKKCKKTGGADAHSKRVQQRRLERLQEILESLKKPIAQEFKPLEMLNCSYLRLSKSNVEELEEMVRQAGQDPGLHYHSDLSNYNLFEDLRREAEALRKETEIDRVRSEMSKSQLSVKSTSSRRRQSLA